MDEDVIWDRVRDAVRQVATSTRQATRECWVLVCSRGGYAMRQVE